MKLIVTFLVILLLAIGGYVAYERFAPPATDAITADLVPADTEIFLTFPDLLETAQRWPKTSLGQMIQSPRLRPFLRRPLSRLLSTPEWQTTQRILQELNVEELFVALRFTSLDDPEVLLAFRAQGGAEAVSATLLRLQETVVGKNMAHPWNGEGFTGWRSESLEHISQADKGMELLTVQGMGWAVLTNRPAWLRDMSLRLQDQPPSPSLYASEAFANTLRPLSDDADVIAYVNTRSLVEKFRSYAEESGATPIPEHFARMERWHAVGFTARLGAETKERLFLLGEVPSPASLPAIASPLAPANTLFLWEGHVAADWLSPESSGLLPPHWQTGLEDTGMDLDALSKALGEIGGLAMWWPGASLTPAFVGVMEVRDTEVVRTQLTRLGAMLAGDAVVREDNGLTTLSFSPSPLMGLISPTLGFESNKVYFSLNPGDLTRALGTPAAGDGWMTSAVWKENASFLREGNWQRSLLDLPAVVDRSLAALQPLLGFASAMNPSLSSSMDVSLLPEAADLRPFLGAVRSREKVLPGEGILAETDGRLTWATLLLTIPAGLPDGWKMLQTVADEE